MTYNKYHVVLFALILAVFFSRADSADFSGSVFLHNPGGEHALPGGGFLVYMYNIADKTWLNPGVTDSYGRFAFSQIPDGAYVLNVFAYTGNYRQLVWKEEVTTAQVLKPMIVLSFPRVVPQASYEPVPDKKDRYVFKVWLEGDGLSEIDSVTYLFNHESFGSEKLKRSSSRTAKFGISYEGWGCLQQVDITAWAQGKPSTIEFYHCTALSDKK